MVRELSNKKEKKKRVELKIILVYQSPKPFTVNPWYFFFTIP